MNVQKKPMSRRRLMKSAAVAPLLALAQQVEAGETTEDDAIEVVKKTALVHESELQEVVEQMRQYYQSLSTGNDFPARKAQMVALTLWSYVRFGMAPWRFEAGVFPKACTYKSGKKITEALDTKFNLLGQDSATNLCAYLLGHYLGAAAEVSLPPNGKVNYEMYTVAWEKVKGEMDTKKKRLFSLEPRPSDDEFGTLGSGC